MQVEAAVAGQVQQRRGENARKTGHHDEVWPEIGQLRQRWRVSQRANLPHRQAVFPGQVDDVMIQMGIEDRQICRGGTRGFDETRRRGSRSLVGRRHHCSNLNAGFKQSLQGRQRQDALHPKKNYAQQSSTPMTI